MLKLRRALPLNHEDLFVQRYERLVAWALALTEGDAARAEDLVHDAFIQFTLSRPDLDRIENLDGYLRTTLRNLHISQMRRAALKPDAGLCTADYDSAELSLRAGAAHDGIGVEEELRLVCEYVCRRKETSKGASVLILRFFHGYYPAEIALLLRSPDKQEGRTAGWWLHLARHEARAYIHDPHAVKFLVEPMAAESESAIKQIRRTAGGSLLDSLRQAIFARRTSSCPSLKELRTLYRKEGQAEDAIDTSLLAHLVSCPCCLDAVNKLLGLPPLAERFPTDMLGPDSRPKSGTGAGGNRGSKPDVSGARGTGKAERRGRGRLRETIEHKPKELHTAANGFTVGVQSVEAERNRLTLKLSLDEPLGFVEVFSEQQVRLCYLPIELPPTGAVKQRTQVALSDNRTLELTVNFALPWTTLDLIYHDPTFATETTAIPDAPPNRAAQATTTQAEAAGDYPSSAWRSRLWRQLFTSRFWLRPSAITVLLAIPLVAALFFLLNAEKPSAAALLRRATVTEQQSTATRNESVRRVLEVEERQFANNRIIARRQVEVWQRAAPTRSANISEVRRVFDEWGNLISGETITADERRTLYHRGVRSQAVLAPQSTLPRTLDDAARFELSVKEFKRIVKEGNRAQVEDRPTAYIINYEATNSASDTPQTSEPQLIKATLTIGKSDIRPVGQTLVIRQGEGLREYRFTQALYERHPASAVAPAVFEPDAELNERMKTEGDRMKKEEVERLNETSKGESAPAHSSSLIPHPSGVATAALEVEVLQLLNAARADLNEQIGVIRTARGTLQIEGIVDTSERKAELLRALAPVADNPAVQVQVQTVAEAVARQRSNRSGALASSASPAETFVERTEVVATMLAADAELRRYFTGRGIADNEIDEEIRRFARATLARSRRAAQHAGALKNIAERFSATELQTLDSQTRENWRALLRSHARALQVEIVALRSSLAPVFSPAESSGGERFDTGDDADVRRVAARLSALSAESDRAVRAAFTVSPDASRANAVKSPQFQVNLHRIERLAALIAGTSDKH